jgi:lipid-A-disaccharide synthase
VLAAADAALLTSGTVTLEAMLYNLPMLVAYRMNWLTFRILSALVQVKFVSLPNLLAGKRVVNEFLQERCRPEPMGRELLELLNNPARADAQRREFTAMRGILQQLASTRAAKAVIALCTSP